MMGSPGIYITDDPLNQTLGVSIKVSSLAVATMTQAVLVQYLANAFAGNFAQYVAAEDSKTARSLVTRGRPIAKASTWTRG